MSALTSTGPVVAEPTTVPAAERRTTLPTRDADAPPPVPRRAVGRANGDELFARVGAWIAALGATWLVTQRFLPLSGVAWFVIVLLVAGIVMTALLSAMSTTFVEVRDRVAGVVVTAGAVAVGLALVSAVVFVFVRGWRPLVHLNFFTDDMAGVEPKAPFTEGGVLHAIIGSGIQLGIGLAVALPLGIGTAVFMTEVGGRFARVVRTVVEAMTALPSIVAGLFIYTTVILAAGVPRSGLAAGLAIGVMMLPIIARAADVVLRVVPGNLREASLALGASRWRTVWHVVLPTARPGLATAVILGVARGVGETSPVLLTSGAAPFITANPVGGAMNSLPLFIYTQVRSGEPNAIGRAFGAAVVLMTLVLALFVIARLVARPRRYRSRPPLRRRLVALLGATRSIRPRRTRSNGETA
ncbi:phosphate ABC transporter permease PstA [Nocardioides daeguensis]|uniref:Phosphate transport system permease protein PstA n=1 Tax=Nocardioides daeguensis TaxID=908359 RepID=A0ABP6W6A9_9ACTN|nr:phosphate ABC transporter permease PstA [Nocardioides daeguensis]MBV6729331.1 phosphate ABC transporter permease PstA [Nocardioides daeguensis]MCR1774307.1 phosphate ABC transporter permease PstA [Nocardioides daeguensis]